jgi:prophage maintenance system killer protein
VGVLYILLLLHGESVAEHGGAAGLRDEGLLDSALARPLNLVAYASPSEQPDVAALAASYCVGLAKNHRFPILDQARRQPGTPLALGFLMDCVPA